MAHRAPAPTGFDAAASQEPFVDDIERAPAPGRVSRGARPGGAVARDPRSLGSEPVRPWIGRKAQRAGVLARAHAAHRRAPFGHPQHLVRTPRPVPSRRSRAPDCARGAPDPRARDVTRPRSHPSDVIVAPQTTLSIGKSDRTASSSLLSLSRSVTTPRLAATSRSSPVSPRSPTSPTPSSAPSSPRAWATTTTVSPRVAQRPPLHLPRRHPRTIACVVGLAVMEPTQLGEPADPLRHSPRDSPPSGTSSPPSTPSA